MKGFKEVKRETIDVRKWATVCKRKKKALFIDFSNNYLAAVVSLTCAVIILFTNST